MGELRASILPSGRSHATVPSLSSTSLQQTISEDAVRLDRAFASRTTLPLLRTLGQGQSHDPGGDGGAGRGGTLMMDDGGSDVFFSRSAAVPRLKRQLRTMSGPLDMQTSDLEGRADGGDALERLGK